MVKPAISDTQKKRIYQLYFEDGFSQSKIANLYDVSQGTISNILRNKVSTSIEDNTITTLVSLPRIVK